MQPYSGKYPSNTGKVIHIYILQIQTVLQHPEIQLTVWIIICHISKNFGTFFMIFCFKSTGRLNCYRCDKTKYKKVALRTVLWYNKCSTVNATADEQPMQGGQANNPAASSEISDKDVNRNDCCKYCNDQDQDFRRHHERV